MTKKLVVSLLGLVLLLPATGFAQSTADIQSMINALMKQIQSLQQQVNQQQGTTSTQTPTQIQPTNYGQVVSACRELRNTLRAGQKGQEVAYLHALLQKEGFSIDSDELSAQEYGESTASSVSGFQEKYKSEILAPVGLKYGSGLVGAGTRKKLNALYNCVKPIVIEPAQNELTIKTESSLNFKMGGFESAVFWITDEVHPSSGMPGNYEIGAHDLVPGMSWTQRTCSSNFTKQDGSCMYNDHIILEGKPTKTGIYEVTIYAKGTGCMGTCPQGKRTFKVTISEDGISEPQPVKPVISGISGPTDLRVGEVGTWKINASSNYNDYLSYSVVWGDEVAYITNSSVMGKQEIKQSATFEHSYQSAGTYNPIFYVTNQNGQSAKTSISVQIGGSGSEIVTEQVKCVFEGDSTNKQNCYFASCSSNSSDYNALGCSGVGACVVDLKGTRGETRSWKSSCGGYATTTMDGQNEYAKFSCGTTTSPLPLTISTDATLPRAKVGQSYVAEIDGYGDVGPYAWNFSSFSTSSIPPGLTGAGMTLANGNPQYGIAGTPTVAGTYTLSLVLGSKNQSTGKKFTIVVDPAQTGSRLIVSKNSSWVGGQKFTRGTSGAKIASFSLAASSAGSVNIDGLKLVCQGCTDPKLNGNDLNNVRLWAGNVQVGQMSTFQAFPFMDFSLSSPFTIPAGSVTSLDVLADIAPSPSVSQNNFYIELRHVTSTSPIDGLPVYATPSNTMLPIDKTYHPADTNKDLRITISEVTAYGNGQYAASAQNIWRNGEVYRWDESKQDWVPTGSTTTTPVNNSSIAVERMFPGQYDNTKYDIILSDPEGLHTVDVRKASGAWLIIGSPVNGTPSCPTQMRSGVTTLSPSDFPLTAKIQDCKDSTVVNISQASMPAVPSTSTSLNVSSASQAASVLDAMRSMLEEMLRRLAQ